MAGRKSRAPRPTRCSPRPCAPRAPAAASSCKHPPTHPDFTRDLRLPSPSASARDPGGLPSRSLACPCTRASPVPRGSRGGQPLFRGLRTRTRARQQGGRKTLQRADSAAGRNCWKARRGGAFRRRPAGADHPHAGPWTRAVLARRQQGPWRHGAGAGEAHPRGRGATCPSRRVNTARRSFVERSTKPGELQRRWVNCTRRPPPMGGIIGGASRPNCHHSGS